MKKIVFAIAFVSVMAGIYSFVPRNNTKDPVTYTVNAENSRVDWIGSKKAGFHTGFFPLKSGQLQVDAGKLQGGKFVIDLANLKVTDAGGNEKLTGHLKTPDFFDVAKFSEATYDITGVTYTSENTADITGNLGIKGLSVPVKFQANIRSADDKGFFAQAFFSLDRTLLGVNYGLGSVSKDVQIAIHIFGTK